MNRPSCSLFALPVVLLAVGCADDDFTLQILENQLLTPPSCTPSNSITEFQTSTGVLDVGIVQGGAGTYPGYTVYPIVKNNLVDSQMPAPIASRADIQIMGVDVEYVVTGALAAALPANQQSFFQPVYGGDIPSLMSESFSAVVLPLQVAIELGEAVPDNASEPMIVRFRAVGTHAGSTITSGWVEFPLNLCRWCLTSGKPPACPKEGLDKASIAIGGCNIAQDTDVTCCVSSVDNRLLCGVNVPMSGM